MKTPGRAINDLIARLFGVRIVRTRKLDRLAGQIVQAEQFKKEAECRAEQFKKEAERRAERSLEKKFQLLPYGSVANDRFLLLGRLLRPQQAQGVCKVRLGGAHDGGYVCLDDFKDMEAALSFGIGGDASWDADVAKRGLTVFQYDHSVAGPPIEHVNFRFSRRKIAANADSECESIKSVLAKNCLAWPTSVILKIDIEHNEWAVFAAAPANALDKFAQVICEFHGFDQITDDQWFERALNVFSKLNDRFAVVHVHANNYSPLLVAGNLLFPRVLEVTYASRVKYTFRDTDETFPGLLDAANLATATDHDLGKFIY